MKNNFYRWLESMGQEPRRLLRDLIFCAAKFYLLLCILIYPLHMLGPKLFPPLPPGTAKAGTLPPGYFQAIMYMNLYLFIGVILILSFMGGWLRLAAKYRAPKKFSEGQLFKWQSGVVGGMNYGSILHIRVAESGLYLKCFFPFNLIQRPLLIPWKEIKAINDVRILWRKSSFMIIGSPKISSLIFEKKEVVVAIHEMWERQR